MISTRLLCSAVTVWYVLDCAYSYSYQLLHSNYRLCRQVDEWWQDWQRLPSKSLCWSCCPNCATISRKKSRWHALLAPRWTTTAVTTSFGARNIAQWPTRCEKLEMKGSKWTASGQTTKMGSEKTHSGTHQTTVLGKQLLLGRERLTVNNQWEGQSTNLGKYNWSPDGTLICGCLRN